MDKIIDRVYNGCSQSLSKDKPELVDRYISFIVQTIIDQKSGKWYQPNENLQTNLNSLSNDDIETMIYKSISKVMELSSLSSNQQSFHDILKMQIDFHDTLIQNEITVEDTILSKYRIISSDAMAIAKYSEESINDGNGLTTELAATLYQKVLNFVTSYSISGKINDTNTENEIKAAFESVYPRSGVNTFIQLNSIKLKVDQLMELGKVILGIRLFNKNIGKGGYGISNIDSEMIDTSIIILNELQQQITTIHASNKYQQVLIVKSLLLKRRQDMVRSMERRKAAAATTQLTNHTFGNSSQGSMMDDDIIEDEEFLSLSLSLSPTSNNNNNNNRHHHQFHDVNNIHTLTTAEGGEGIIINENQLFLWINQLSYHTQYLFYLYQYQQSFKLLHMKVHALHLQLSSQCHELNTLIGSKSVISKELVYPRFMALGTVWFEVEEEAQRFNQLKKSYDILYEKYYLEQIKYNMIQVDTDTNNNDEDGDNGLKSEVSLQQNNSKAEEKSTRRSSNNNNNNNDNEDDYKHGSDALSSKNIQTDNHDDDDDKKSYDDKNSSNNNYDEAKRQNSTHNNNNNDEADSKCNNTSHESKSNSIHPTNSNNDDADSKVPQHGDDNINNEEVKSSPASGTVSGSSSRRLSRKQSSNRMNIDTTTHHEDKTVLQATAAAAAAAADEQYGEDCFLLHISNHPELSFVLPSNSNGSYSVTTNNTADSSSNSANNRSSNSSNNRKISLSSKITMNDPNNSNYTTNNNNNTNTTTTAIRVEFNGYCPWSVTDKHGLLMPGNISLGVIQYKQQYYLCENKIALQAFVKNPSFYIDRVHKLILLQPEYLLILNQQYQEGYLPLGYYLFPIIPKNSTTTTTVSTTISTNTTNTNTINTGDDNSFNNTNTTTNNSNNNNNIHSHHIIQAYNQYLLRYQSSSTKLHTIKCDASTETPTHFLTNHIVPNYHWNEWDMKRDILKIVNLTNCKTKSQQTVNTHFRRDNTTQVYLPKDNMTQTKRDQGTNPKLVTMYIAGMNGVVSSDSALVKATKSTFNNKNRSSDDSSSSSNDNHIKNGMPSKYITMKNAGGNKDNNKVVPIKSIGARVVTLTLDL